MVRRSRQISLAAALVLGAFLAAVAAVGLRYFGVAFIGGSSNLPSENEKAASRMEPAKQSTLSSLPALPNTFSETVKLVDPSPSTAVQMGFSVAISGDIAIVGNPGEADNKGSGFIYVRNGGTWELQQEIAAIDGNADGHFGWSVAISGETAVVGAYDLNEVDGGAAYVFIRSGLTWTQQEKLMPSNGTATDQFGLSVAIDGETIVVGASGRDQMRGAGYVYVRNGSKWTEQQMLTAADAAPGDEFGTSVGISGETVVIGAPGDDSLRGGAYVFDRNGTSWAQTAKLTAPDGAPFDRFASSLAIDGERTVIGAPLDSVNGSLNGSAYAFARAAGTWQQQKLVAADGEDNDKFGESVSISGVMIAIGANGDDIGPIPDQGSAYIFTLSGGQWTQAQKLFGSDGQAGDNFGGSVAMGPGVVAVGSYLDDTTLLDPGSATVFSGPIPVVSVAGRVLTPHGAGLKSATVMIRDAESGTSRSVSTSTLGYFEFQVEAGRDYVIFIYSRRYRFASVPISVDNEISDLEIIGLE